MSECGADHVTKTIMNGFDSSEQNNSTSGAIIHIPAKRSSNSLNNNSFESNAPQTLTSPQTLSSQTLSSSQSLTSPQTLPSTQGTSSSSASSTTERMRSGSSDAQIHSGISSTTPIWTTGNSYEFDSYQNHNNGAAAPPSSSSSCCMSGTTASHHPPPPPSATGSYYYASSTPDSASSRPCKPAPTKFWANSAYDPPVNGPSTQMSGDPIVAAAVCHGSAFAAAAAHHAAAANHVAAWCNYSPYHQTGRADPYLTGETDHRTSFVDTYHHPAMRSFTSVGADQGCSGSSVSGWNQTASVAPPPTSATGELILYYIRDK